MAHVQCQWLQNAVKNRTPRVSPSVSKRHSSSPNVVLAMQNGLQRHLSFPTSLCGVLVFRLDPAGAAFASPSAASSSSLPHHSLAHSLTHSFIHSFTHSLTHSLTVQIASWLPLAWQAQYTELPGGAVARWPPLARGCLLPGRQPYTEPPHFPFAWQAQYCRASWRSCGAVAAAGPRLPFAWQAQYIEPAAAFCLAGAVHMSLRTSLVRGRRST